jgi:alkaline phosphatase D
VAPVQASLADNPHIRFFEGVRRGYVRCTVTPDLWQTDYRGVTSILEPTAPIDTIASYVVERGTSAIMEG